MRAVRVVVVSCVVAAAAVLAVSSSTPAAAQQTKDAGAGAAALPACVSISTQARYVPYGYNHVVILKNGCSKIAKCTVATDVNPQPTSVEVASAATIEVLTFAASPAATFKAQVTCALSK